MTESDNLPKQPDLKPEKTGKTQPINPELQDLLAGMRDEDDGLTGGEIQHYPLPPADPKKK